MYSSSFAKKRETSADRSIAPSADRIEQTHYVSIERNVKMQTDLDLGRNMRINQAYLIFHPFVILRHMVRQIRHKH